MVWVFRRKEHCSGAEDHGDMLTGISAHLRLTPVCSDKPETLRHIRHRFSYLTTNNIAP